MCAIIERQEFVCIEMSNSSYKSNFSIWMWTIFLSNPPIFAPINFALYDRVTKFRIFECFFNFVFSSRDTSFTRAVLARTGWLPNMEPARCVRKIATEFDETHAAADTAAAVERKPTSNHRNGRREGTKATFPLPMSCARVN